MILLEKPPTDKTQICLYDNQTLICGIIFEVDYFTKVESKMNEEPYYGDVDLFGF
jgi:hypothetical protein